MFKRCFALLTLTMTMASVLPAAGQSPPGTKVGVLSCTLSPSIGFVIGSRQTMACRFTPDGPFPPEAYLGTIDTVGLDIGVTGGGVMGWAVFAPTAGPPR